MAYEITATEVQVTSSSYSRNMQVVLECSVADLVDAIDSEDVLDHLGVEKAKKYFDLVERDQ